MTANVTDHAVLRWLERACGIDVEAVRDLIGDCCARGLDADCRCIVVDGVKFITRQDGAIVTALHKRPYRKRRRSRSRRPDRSC